MWYHKSRTKLDKHNTHIAMIINVQIRRFMALTTSKLAPVLVDDYLLNGGIWEWNFMPILKPMMYLEVNRNFRQTRLDF